MRAKHFIVEYSREKTSDVHGEKIIQAIKNDKQPRADLDIWNAHSRSGQWNNLHDNDKNALLTNVMGQIESGDPTKNLEYSQWLARMYSRGVVPLEDIKSKMRDALEKYHQFKIKKKLKPEHKDINQMKSPYDLLQAMEQYDEDELKPEVTDKGNAKQIYKDETIRVIVPKNEAASCYYGQGTRWCTAGRNRNMFDTYNPMDDMFIVIPTNPQYEGEKYQLHFPTEQFMDEKDNSVNPTELTQQYPSLLKVPQITIRAHHNHIPGFMSPGDRKEYEEEMTKQLEKNAVAHGDMYTISLNQPGGYDHWAVSKYTIGNLIHKGMMESEYENLPQGAAIYGWFDSETNQCRGVTYSEFDQEVGEGTFTVIADPNNKDDTASDYDTSDIVKEPDVQQLEKFLDGLHRISKETSMSGEAYEKAVIKLIDTYGYPMSGTGYPGQEPERA